MELISNKSSVLISLEKGDTVLLTVPDWLTPFKPGSHSDDTYRLSDIYIYPYKYWPEKIAIKDGRRQYTFRQLYNGTFNFADFLIKTGVKSGDNVVVVAPKTADIAIIAASIWKAGAVYVPIDPANPPLRVQYIVNSVKPVLIIVPDGYQSEYLFKNDDRTVISFSVAIAFADKPLVPHAIFPVVYDNALAYIMHTSGSTGEPKGVMIEHGSVLSYFGNHNRVLQFTENSYCLSQAPFYFDVSIEDTFLPLSVGARVYQYSGLPVSKMVLNLIEREKITHIIAVSTVLTLITGDGIRLQNTDLSCLEMLMTGAEVCDVKVINKWKECAPQARVYNVYGPTETTIVCTAYEVNHADSKREEFYPIGQPLVNVKALLMGDNEQEITGSNTRGELYIGGRQVMRGYWKDEILSAKVMFNYDGEVYYKTGDFCYRNEDGDFVFCGRADDEIKLSGRRINLSEIKLKLFGFSPDINGVAAGIIRYEGRNVLAVVIAVYTATAIVRLLQIKKELRRLLPLYMIPDFVGFIEDTLMSSTGKIDEKRLMLLLEQAVAKKDGGDCYIYDGRGYFVIA